MENMVLGLEVTLFGMGATFLALSVLAILLNLMKKIFNRKSKAAVQTAPAIAPNAASLQSQTSSSPANQPDDLDLIVVIAAAVAAIMTNEHGDVVNHRITSITPVVGAAKTDGFVLASAK